VSQTHTTVVGAASGRWKLCAIARAENMCAARGVGSGGDARIRCHAQSVLGSSAGSRGFDASRVRTRIPRRNRQVFGRTANVEIRMTFEAGRFLVQGAEGL
jgi:hypothetical protein